MARKKRKKPKKAEGSELFQNGHTWHISGLVPTEDDEPFVHIIGDSKKKPKRKKPKREWTFVDDD